MTHGTLTYRIALIHTLVGAVCMLAVSIAADAQQRQVRPSQQRVLVSPVRAVPAQAEGDPDLPIIAPRASRTQIDPPSLQLDAGPADTEASPPKALTGTQKAAYLKGGAAASGGGIAAPDGSLKTLTLTVKAPFVQNQGYVGFSQPWSVNPDSGRVSFRPSSQNAFVWISANVVEGNRYLVDLLVFGTRSQTYTVIHEDGEQSFEEGAGGKHLLLVLDPEGSGYVSLTLEGDNYFSFYSVEISRLD